MNLSTSLLLTSVLLVVGGGVQAFLTPSSYSPMTITRLSMSKTQLNELDEMCIENVADLCLKAEESLADECDLDEYEALVNQLEDQKELMEAHMKRVDNLLHRLKNDGLAEEEPEQTYFAG